MSPIEMICVHLLTFMVLVGHKSIVVETYRFCEGTDNDITFRSSLSGNSGYEYEVYSWHLECLFYENGVVVGEHCLKAGQVHRFIVKANNTEDELTVTLTVSDVRKEDAGVYILIVAQDRDGESHTDVKEAYIDVIIPPGPAECEVMSSSYSADWMEVHCSALLALDSDPQGSIACFQNDRKASFFRQPELSNDHIQAVFWMDIESSINCCSFAQQCEKSPELCRDFIFRTGTTSTYADVTDAQKRELTTTLQSTRQQSSRIIPTLKYTESQGSDGKHFSTGVCLSVIFSVFVAFFFVIINLIVRKRYIPRCCEKCTYRRTERTEA